MGVVETLLVTVLAGGAGLLMALIGVGYLQTYWRVRGADPVDVGRLNEPSGAVEMTGTAAVHEETSRSPFTDTETLVQEWKVRKYHKSGESTGWHTLKWEHDAHSFLLEDGTGTALVDPAGVSRELQETETIEVEPDQSPPPEVGEYLESTDDVSTDHGRKRQYIEYRLDAGDDVHVLGPVRETGQSVDMPGGADAVVGLDDPDRGLTIGEDDITLSALVDQIRADSTKFILRNDDESGAQRHFLKSGVIWLAVGLLFLAIPVFLLI